MRPRALDWIVAGILMVAALAIRLVFVRAVVFPPLDDPAFYLLTAENVVTGRGLEVDVLWSYQVDFPSVVHPSHEHWMPLTTGLIAGAYALQRAISGTLETSLPIGQMPGLVLGALLAPLTYLAGRRALSGERISGRKPRWDATGVPLAAALLITFNATLSYQSASADSSAPFALIGAWALAIAVRRPGDQGGYFGLGVLAALAYLTRADGLLLLLAIPLAWWLLPMPQYTMTGLPDNPAAELVWRSWPRERGLPADRQRALGPSLANVLDLGVAFALLVTPWLVRNYLAFGTPLPVSVLSQAWLVDYVDTFNYTAHPTWESWLNQGWQIILQQRLQALLHNGQVFLLSTFPWGLLALPGLWLLRREWSFFPSLVYGLLLFFGMALVFPVSSMSGTFYHSMGAIVPFLALAAMVAVQRGVQALGRYRRFAPYTLMVATMALLVMAGFQVTRALHSVAERHQAEKEQFEAIGEWLAQNAAPGDVIMTTQTHTLTYASGHPSIALPGNEAPDSARAAAQRYGARYLVITQAFGRYPQVLHEQPDPRFRLLYASEATEIYEILPSPQGSAGRRSSVAESHAQIHSGVLCIDNH